MNAFDAMIACMAFLIACVAVSFAVMLVITTVVNKKKGKFEGKEVVVGIGMAIISLILGVLFMWIAVNFVR